ncbi:MAG TPA: glycine zipper family protein [Stellaceae bacterium]|nr:glycine zipper family protein [Stellaceae bacterium]
MIRIVRPVILAGALALGACAVAPPTGPSVMALPAQGKSFEAFQQDDNACRQYASAQIGFGSPADAATQSAVNSTVLGTVLGGAAGAAIGAAAGNPALGAAIGAGSGLVFGGAAGANAAGLSQADLQRRYDIGYIQCMTAKGESVPQSLPAYAGSGYPYPYYAYGYGYPPPYPYYPYYYGPAFIGGGFVVFHGGHHGHHWGGHGHH